MHILGWMGGVYNSEVIFRGFPKGRWELIGFLEVSRHPWRADAWLIECALQNCANPNAKTVAQADVAWLPCLLPGSIIENGVIVGDNLEREIKKETVEEKSLLLNIEADSLIDFDIRDQEDVVRVDKNGKEGTVLHNIIPFKVLQYKGLSQTRYRLVGVRHGGDDYAIVIPASVLAHFYFAGVSSKLAQALFTGRLSSIVDLRRCGFLDEDRLHYTIALRANVSDIDGWMLARVLASPRGSAARQAYYRVHNSLMRAKVNGDHSMPKALFPFLGQTNLTMLGTPFSVWDGNGNRLRKRFFVRRLLTCTADWPIDYLTIQRHGLAAQAEGTEVHKNVVTLRRADVADQLNMSSENSPNTAMTPVTIPLAEATDRFPALSTKTTIIEVRPYDRKTGLLGAHIVDGGVVDEGSTLPGSDSNSNVVPVDLVSGDETLSKTISEPDAPEQNVEDQPMEEMKKRLVADRSVGNASFLIVLEHLAKWGVAVQSIAVTKEVWELEGHRFGIFPCMPKSKGWELLNKPRSTGQTKRLALAAELRYGNAAGAIYFIEPRDDETTGCIMLALAPKGQGFPTAAHEEILDGVRKLRRVWGHDSDCREVNDVVDSMASGYRLRFRRIEHRHANASAYAGIIFDHLKATAAQGGEDSQTGEQ